MTFDVSDEASGVADAVLYVGEVKYSGVIENGLNGHKTVTFTLPIGTKGDVFLEVTDNVQRVAKLALSDLESLCETKYKSSMITIEKTAPNVDTKPVV